MISFAIKSTYVSAGKHESIMSVHIYSLRAEALDCKRDFRIFLGMIGSSVECYADAVRPKLS